MFACVSSVSAPLPALVALAEGFTPRFEVVGPLVLLDVSGLSRLFGSPRDIGEQLRRAGADLRSDGDRRAMASLRVAVAPTQTSAALLALGRAGLTVVEPGESAGRLANLPVGLLADLDRVRLAARDGGPLEAARARDRRAASGTGGAPTIARGETASGRDAAAPIEAGPEPGARGTGASSRTVVSPPQVGEMFDALPYFHATLERASDAAQAAHRCGGGWRHPRDAHVAQQMGVRGATPAGGSQPVPRPGARAPGLRPEAPGTKPQVRGTRRVLADIDALAGVLRRWGVRTIGDLVSLPAGEVYERLGARGVVWQRLGRGEDAGPLVPWIPEDPFEDTLELEWPIEGLEPLSFVLGRLLEPLADRLERADRGAAVLHTHLRLVSKAVHARTLQLPAPMRDPRTLRTLLLLDLESNPPPAAIDRVRVLVEPTPARVTQWQLFERTQPAPEEVATLLARLTALMGETHVGSPRLVDTWKPGAFVMEAFEVRGAEPGTPYAALGTAHAALGTPHAAPGTPHSAHPGTALRRFRLPIPARVRVQDGRPVRVMTDRPGLAGGAVVQAAGPWRTSGAWWNDAAGAPSSHLLWNRDEWDLALADGTIYRVFVERDVGHWFLEGIID